jgi:NADH-quinone oxidoreductase subunit G
VADLCPVGALTHRPWAHNARSWEFRKTESIDAMDAVGSAIRVDTRGREVMRILPRVNDAVNEEWISDKTRHIVDGLKTQRLDQPYVRDGGRLRPAAWDEALGVIAQRLAKASGDGIGAIAGDLAGAEEMFALKQLLGRFGSTSFDCRQDGAKLDPSLGRASYIFNSRIEGIDQADAILLVGTDPRLEAAVLNARIRRRWRQGGLSIGAVGARADLNYAVDWLGDTPAVLRDLAAGKHAFGKVLADAKAPMVIVGGAALRRADGAAVLSAAARIADAAMQGKDAGWNAFNVLHDAASRVGGLDLGFVPDKGKGGRDVAGMLKGDMQVVYLLGADEIDMSRLGNAFVIYQGTHGDAGAHRADVILPGAAYTEKSATYVNTEGRVQMTQKAVFPPGDAKEDWAIVRALSARLGKTLPYDTLAALRSGMYRSYPQLARIDHLEPSSADDLAALRAVKGEMSSEPFAPAVGDFYMSNPIARSSAIMAELSAMKAGPPRAEAAE